MGVPINGFELSPKTQSRSCKVLMPALVAKEIFNPSQFCYCLSRAPPAAQLYAELSQLNLNLPARVCVPLYGSRHQVLRVPKSEAVVLNSKSKVSDVMMIHFWGKWGNFALIIV